MPFQVIPNTESEKVALVAIAWEIVEQTVVNELENGLSYDERKRIATNAFIDVYEALLNSKRIGEKDAALFEGAYLFSKSEENHNNK